MKYEMVPGNWEAFEFRMEIFCGGLTSEVGKNFYLIVSQNERYAQIGSGYCDCVDPCNHDGFKFSVEAVSNWYLSKERALTLEEEFSFVEHGWKIDGNYGKVLEAGNIKGATAAMVEGLQLLGLDPNVPVTVKAEIHHWGSCPDRARKGRKEQ